MSLPRCGRKARFPGVSFPFQLTATVCMESLAAKIHKPPHVILLSGTHVTGKETLASNIASNLGCRWIKSEMMHSAAGKAARAQSQKGLEYNAVFGRVYSAKLQ